MLTFEIAKNNYLTKSNIVGYCHQEYLGFNIEGNPDFINILKNTFGNTPIYKLNQARNTVERILNEDLKWIIKKHNFENCVCIPIPRAQELRTYTSNQLLFRKAVSNVARVLEFAEDGTEYIVREKNTRTTHLAKAVNEGRYEENYGELPYPGITKDTCNIRKNYIEGKNILLIDDIYTKTVNIDEDCIQALFDSGAKQVIFYSIGYTVGR